MTTRIEAIEAAIEARDLGAAVRLLDALSVEHRAAGLLDAFPAPASPEGARRRLLRTFNVLRTEIEDTSSGDTMTDPQTGTTWRYRSARDDGREIESYERVEG